jgi:hypothetical protein
MAQKPTRLLNLNGTPKTYYLFKSTLALYVEPDESYPHSPILKLLFYILLPPTPCFPFSLLSGFPIKFYGSFSQLPAVLRASYSLLHSFTHLAVCLTTGPKPLPKRALHIVRSRASFFKCEYPLLSLRTSSSFLRLLPRLPATSIPPLIFPSITCCSRHFLRKM